MAQEKTEQAVEKNDRTETLPAPMRARLEALIDEMLDGKVAFGDANEEFKKLYVKRALARSGASITSVARSLGVNRRFLQQVLSKLKHADDGRTTARAEGRGKARRHFGAWDSGDERSADNERIDSDLAREYDNSR